MAFTRNGIRGNHQFPQMHLSERHVIRRSVAQRSSPAQLHPTVATATDYKRDPELQAALDAFFADTLGQGRHRVPTREVQHHIDRFEELGRRLGLTRVHPEWNDGAFSGTVTTMMSGITSDDRCSLARLTFGKVAPGDLMLQIGTAEAVGLPGMPDQWKGPLAHVDDSPDHGYSVVTYFSILDSGVLGKIAVKGVYSVDEEDPAKMHVNFVGFTVEPAVSDERSLTLWREALAEHNPGMTATGAIECRLDPPLRSHLRYIVMDPDMQLAIGGSGSLTCMARVAPVDRC